MIRRFRLKFVLKILSIGDWVFRLKPDDEEYTADDRRWMSKLRRTRKLVEKKLEAA
jgi:hypothetical protein